MSGKIDKIISRLQERIAEGQFYEAQQQTRVVAARYVKQENWAAAVGILYNVAQSLLKAAQGGSGGDLSVYLVEVYNQAELKPDANNKGKLLTLLRLFDPEEPSRKKFIGEMISWSAKCGEYPAGEPDIHHVVGALYAEERDVYEAERHLALGTRDSAEILARLEYDWYREDEPHKAPLYSARAVFPYLLVGNVRDASKCLRLFTGWLNESSSNLAEQSVSSGSAEVRIYPSLPLVNFQSLLLLAVQKGNADLFRQLRSHYAAQIKDAQTWEEALDLVAEMYFGIQKPRQSNPLFDIMGNMFGGGAAPKSHPKRVRAPAPVADGLD